MRCYGDNHQWVDFDGKRAKVGLRKKMVDELIPLVWIKLPEVGSRVKQGEEAVVLESSKAAIDIVSPLSGKVVEVHKELSLELLEKDPEHLGWFFVLDDVSCDELKMLREETSKSS
jgi:glycine cleavage system H protein